MMIMNVLTFKGDVNYERLLGQIRDDQALRQVIWEHARGDLREDDERLWSISTVDDVPAAWCSAIPTGWGYVMGWKTVPGALRPVMQIQNQYIREPYRDVHTLSGTPLYAHTLAALDRRLLNFIVESYVYVDPLPLFLERGYRVIDEGDDEHFDPETQDRPYRWYRVRRVRRDPLGESIALSESIAMAMFGNLRA